MFRFVVCRCWFFLWNEPCYSLCARTHSVQWPSSDIFTDSCQLWLSLHWHLHWLCPFYVAFYVTLHSWGTSLLHVSMEVINPNIHILGGAYTSVFHLKQHSVMWLYASIYLFLEQLRIFGGVTILYTENCSNSSVGRLLRILPYGSCHVTSLCGCW